MTYQEMPGFTAPLPLQTRSARRGCDADHLQRWAGQRNFPTFGAGGAC